MDGKPGVLLMVGAQVGVDTLAVTARLEAALDELRRCWSAKACLCAPTCSARRISSASPPQRPVCSGARRRAGGDRAARLPRGLAHGAHQRGGDPAPLVSAALVLQAWGESLNTMTLGGLALAIARWWTMR